MVAEAFWKEHVMTHSREDRPWGHFLQFFNNVKILVVNPGESLSLQYHKHRDEYWFVLEGVAHVTLGEREISLKPGDDIWVPRLTQHRIRASSDAVRILEIPQGHFNEQDIVRIHDRYGRS